MNETELSAWAAPHVVQPHEHKLMGSGEYRASWFANTTFASTLSNRLAALRRYENEHGVAVARPVVERYFKLVKTWPYSRVE